MHEARRFKLLGSIQHTCQLLWCIIRQVPKLLGFSSTKVGYLLVFRGTHLTWFQITSVCTEALKKM